MQIRTEQKDVMCVEGGSGAEGILQYMGKREQGGRIAVLTSPLLELECNRWNTGVQCSECGWRFRRPGDMKRHKCVSEGQASEGAAGRSAM